MYNTCMSADTQLAYTCYCLSEISYSYAHSCGLVHFHNENYNVHVYVPPTLLRFSTVLQVMRDIINARMQELSGESLLVREKAPPKQDEPEWNRDEVTPLSSSNDRDTNPEQGINVDNSQELSRSEAVSQGATSEQLHGREGKLEYDSRSRRGHGEGSKSREWSQRSISRERSRRSNSRERSQRSRSREKAMGKRSRSRSRERRHDRHSQCDHKDRDRHRKRSRDRDSRTYKKGELPVRDKHHHSSRSGDKGKKKKGKDRSGSMEKRSDS